MSSELIRIIYLFNESQVSAIEVLEHQFNCPRPTDCMDYILRCVPVIRKANYTANGASIRPHGIGMMVDTGKEKIDFDFGESGEFNGFDAYRLANYVRLNKVQTDLNTEQKMKEEFETAVASNLLVKGNDSNVFYLNS